jgi:DNA-binding Lrp family transcriptional regulator
MREASMKNEIECEDTIAFILIKAELGMAAKVAAAVSSLNWEEEGEEGPVVRGVRWADLVTGPYDVVAAVRVRSNYELGKLVIERIQAVTGVKNPLTLVSSAHFKDGRPQAAGQNGHP